MRSIRSRVVALATVLLMLAGGFVAASSSLAGGSKRAAVGANPPSPVGGNAPAPPVVPAAPANAVVGTAQRSFVSAGSGSDSNPCTRSAPCRNFQAAIAQTVSGGEVVALDSGGYGPVTINQAITLVAPPGVYAGVTAFSGPAIGINAGSTDDVYLIGLTLNGLGAGEGIAWTGGRSLHVQRCQVKSFTNYGIDASLSGNTQLFVEDSLLADNGFAGLYATDSAALLEVSVDHVRSERNQYGFIAALNTKIGVRDSLAARNQFTGFVAQEASTQALLENSMMLNNGFGTYSAATGALRVSETTIFGNGQGVGGPTISFGNNRLGGNNVDGSFTAVTPLQ